LSLFRCIWSTARGLFSIENFAHASRVPSEPLVLDRERCHPRIANAVLPGQAIGRSRPAHDLSRGLQKATLFLRRLIGLPRHFVEHLLKIDTRISLQSSEQRRRKRGVGARGPIERGLAKLG